MTIASLFTQKAYSNENSLEDFDIDDQVIFDRRKNLGVRNFLRCKFNNGILFQNISGSGELDFTECDFNLIQPEKNPIELGTQSRHHIIFTKCRFHCDITIETGVTYKYWFIDCEFMSNFTLKAVNANADIRFITSTFNTVHFNNIKCESVQISGTISKSLSFNNVFVNRINISNGDYNDISFNNCRNFQSLNILNNSFDRSKIKINSLSIGYINLRGQILIQGAIINKYNISPFNNDDGRFKHQNLSFIEEVVMMDSDLSDVQFNEIDFSSCNLCLDNSYLSDTVFSNILWPNNKNATHYSDTIHFKTLNDPKNWKIKNKHEKALIKKEIYRQLKNSCKAESNNIDALDFYKNEMLSYWKYIKGNKEISRWDRFLVRVSKWAGDFGLSYTKPLKRIAIIHSSLFILLILLNYQELCFTCRELSWNSFSSGLGEYVYLLNPMHKLKEGLTGWEISIDFIMRLFNGFFIYHFIRATRKFAKL